MSELQGKGEEWLGKITKMITLFAILGLIVLCLAVTMISKAFTDMLAPTPDPSTTTSKPVK